MATRTEILSFIRDSLRNAIIAADMNDSQFIRLRDIISNHLNESNNAADRSNIIKAFDLYKMINNRRRNGSI